MKDNVSLSAYLLEKHIQRVEDPHPERLCAPDLLRERLLPQLNEPPALKHERPVRDVAWKGHRLVPHLGILHPSVQRRTGGTRW